jgi:hypothetical protein
MALSSRSWLIWTALTGTLIAAKFAPDTPSAATIAAPVAKAAPVATQNRKGANTVTDPWKAANTVSDPDEVLELHPRDDDPRPGTTFASMTWGSPQPARAAAAPPVEPQPAPAPPAAPPLPFRILGRFEQQGKRSVFMQYNEQTVVASAGLVINDLYRVEEVTDASVTLIYLPLGERQVLNVASAN